MFGLSAVVLMALSGIAIDVTRAHSVKYKIQDALDAAALAAAKNFDNEYATAEMFQTTGKAFFDAHIKELGIDGVSTHNLQFVPDMTGSSVVGRVDVAVKTYFGFASGDVTKIDFSPTSKVVYKPKKIEMSLVLDITGSMCDSPPANTADACSTGTKISALKSAANSMIESLAATGPATAAIRVSIVPYSASVNAGSYAGTVSSGESTDGCVVERKGGQAYSDEDPFGSNALEASSTSENKSYSCPSARVLPLTDISTKSGLDKVKNAIAALTGFGGTAGHIGTAWGWYTISPDWSSVWPSASQPKPYDKEKTIKVIVLMTDGMFNTAYRNGGQNYVWPDAATGDPTKPGTSGYQALRLCENISKTNGDVQIYTIGFQTPLEAEALLKQCSGEANFMNANSSSQLVDAFTDIAKRLTNMRISG